MEHDFAPARKAHPGLAVSSYAALCAVADRLERSGAPVSWETDARRPTRFHTLDPWGNRLELLTTEPAADG